MTTRRKKISTAATEPKKETQAQIRARAAESDWTPLAAFLRDEGLTPDDIVRLIDLGARPRMEEVNGVMWVHKPTLIDWRELAKIYGFKPLRSMHSTRELEHVT